MSWWLEIALLAAVLSRSLSESESAVIEKRVVNGYTSPERLFYVLLRPVIFHGGTYEASVCGAVLIAPSFVVTAAHCLTYRSYRFQIAHKVDYTQKFIAQKKMKIFDTFATGYDLIHKQFWSLKNGVKKWVPV